MVARLDRIVDYRIMRPVRHSFNASKGARTRATRKTFNYPHESQTVNLNGSTSTTSRGIYHAIFEDDSTGKRFRVDMKAYGGYKRMGSEALQEALKNMHLLQGTTIEVDGEIVQEVRAE